MTSQRASEAPSEHSKAAHETEAALQARALAACEQGVWEYEIATGGIIWDARTALLFGLDQRLPCDLQALSQRVHPDDRAKLEDAMRAALNAKGTGRLEVDIRTLAVEGGVNWISMVGAAEFRGEGDGRRPVRVSGLARARRLGESPEENVQFRRLFHAFDEGFCVCEMVTDVDGAPQDYRFLEINSHFEAMTGLYAAQGRTALEMLPNLERSWVETYARVALGGETLRFEQGSAVMGRWFDVFATPLEPSGRFAIVFKDITKQKLAEAALRESEQRFRQMADDAPVMIWVTEPDGQVVFTSRSWERFTGQPIAQSLGSGWLQRVHPADRERVDTAFTTANKHQAHFRTEHRLLGPDGAEQWVICAACPRYDPNQRFLGYIGSVFDITDRKSAEQELARANALLDAIFRSAPVGLGVWDRDFRFQRVNQRLAEINGIAAEAHIGKRPDELLPNIAGLEEVLARWETILQTGEPWLDVEIIGTTPAAPQDVRSWNESFFPIQVQGEIVGLGAVVEETTERKRADASLRSLIDELNHRVKNTLAIVQSLARQSLRNDPVGAAARLSFEARLKALSTAHDVLTRENWQRALVRDIAMGARDACALNVDQFRLEGPNAELSPKQAVSLSLALHELSTNAVKYGALSQPAGRVEVRWTIEDADGARLRLAWRELHGPPVSQPAKFGFGTRLLREVLAKDLGGEVLLEFDPNGVRCLIETPLKGQPKP